MPRVLARFNRHVTNPIQRHWAGRIPAHGILEHTGRKSGRTYRTPLLAFRTADGFVLWVGYGLQSDWLRNLLAANGARLQHRGRHYAVSNPQLLHGEEARAKLPALLRVVSKLANSKDVVVLAAEPA